MIQRRSYIERRTPIKPGKPPERKTWVKRRRERERRTSCVRDEAYKAAARKLPCVGLPGGVHDQRCRPHIRRDASHLARDGGMGMKGSDTRCVPHSRPCHDRWGDDKSWSQEERRAFMEWAVAATHAELKRRGLYSFAPAAAADDASGEWRVPW
jgi:hypothetical protein